jgi:hypothetical protein
MKRISQFPYAITNPLPIYRRPVKFLSFLPTVQPISHCCLSGQHSDTRGTLADTKDLSSEFRYIKYQVEIYAISMRIC